MQELSILMATYNRESLMQPTIRSILRQTYSDFVFWVCDDGSEDGTWETLQKLARSDSRIQLLRNDKNMGVPFTHNRLIDACETKYACWQGSDDLSNIHRLRLMLNHVKKSGGMVGSKFEVINGLWAAVNYDELPRIDMSGKLANGSLLFPVDKSIRFPEDGAWYGTDAVWRSRMEEKYPTICLNVILYYIRFHRNRIGSAKRVYRKLPPEVRKGMSYVDTLKHMDGHR